jgi:hypothetical protein
MSTSAPTPATSSKDENYCVYVHFEDREADLLDAVSAAVQAQFAHCLARRVTERAHITVLYGPLLPAGTPEVATPTDVHFVLGRPVLDAVAAYARGATVVYQGVSVFDRRALSGQIIVKAEFACPLGDAVRVAAWASLPAMEARRAAEEARLRGAGDTLDDTYAATKPLRWAHATLAILDGSKATDADVLAIQEVARTLLARGDMPSVCAVKDCALMSAISWTPVSLCNA